jgi:hypothetical protein
VIAEDHSESAMARISKCVVDALDDQDAGRIIWDSDLRGFGVKVGAKGNKIYVLQFRMGGREAKTRRFTIGRHGSPWTPESARAEAQRLLMLVRKGVDPMQAERDRRDEAAAFEVSRYADSFVERYLKRNWPKFWQDGQRALTLHVVPNWRGRSIRSITRRDVSDIVDTLDHRPAMARLVFATVWKMFRWSGSARLAGADSPGQDSH